MNALAITILAALPVAAIVWGRSLPGWVFMWTLAIAIFAACKGMTYLHARTTMPSVTRPRAIAYLFAWPGMDPRAFFSNISPTDPRTFLHNWGCALFKITTGAVFVWLVARHLIAQSELFATWVAMVGVMFLLHFGFLDLLSHLWRRAGVDAQPLMRTPALATSLADFWGRRWNTGFHVLAVRYVFQPLHRRIGAQAALFAGFIVSGLIHDAVISLPARAGYGLPTLYFAFQPLGIAVQRSTLGRRLALDRGVLGWFSTLLVVAAPLRLLFHDAFVLRVMLPFFRALGAM